jgi:Zn finger protein HypA/HybF involved in hydrogenase expression
MRNDILESKGLILKWIDENQSKSFMCEQFNCRPSTLERYLKKIDIEYKGNQGGKGIKTDPKRKSALEYSKSTLVKSHVMKLKLIEDGIKEHKCENCGITEWFGVPSPLELHHIDGDRFNNNFINLQILCPNCHSQTPNYSGKK